MTEPDLIARFAGPQCGLLRQNLCHPSGAHRAGAGLQPGPCRVRPTLGRNARAVIPVLLAVFFRPHGVVPNHLRPLGQHA